MGASVVGYWRGITEEQLESQPGFWNDCPAFANWMAVLGQDRTVVGAVLRLVGPGILTFITDGIDESEVDWVPPKELERAALKLRERVLEHDPLAAPILAAYERGANGDEPVEVEFARDLANVAEIARFAEREGVREMTLEVNW